MNYMTFPIELFRDETATLTRKVTILINMEQLRLDRQHFSVGFTPVWLEKWKRAPKTFLTRIVPLFNVAIHRCEFLFRYD